MLPIKQYALLFIEDMENQKVQEQLIDIYTRLKQLKSEGVKMKDIAERTNMVPSVLRHFTRVCCLSSASKLTRKDLIKRWTMRCPM